MDKDYFIPIISSIVITISILGFYLRHIEWYHLLHFRLWLRMPYVFVILEQVFASHKTHNCSL